MRRPLLSRKTAKVLWENCRFAVTRARPEASSRECANRRQAISVSEYPSRALRCSRRRALARSHPLDSISPALLSPFPCSGRCFAASSWMVFVSVTSACWPTANAPPYCHCASLPWVRFQCRSNRKPPLKNRTLFGAAPTVADPWRSPNDLPLLKSNSVLHLCGSQLRHETARPQLENSARLTALRPRPPFSRPDPCFAPCIPPFSTFDSPSHPLDNLHLRFRADSRQLQHLFLAPFNLHKGRVRRASGFLLTAFSNARLIHYSAPHRSPRARLAG
jgi:hypothetical protein